jgi:hypothetical protein
VRVNKPPLIAGIAFKVLLEILSAGVTLKLFIFKVELPQFL